MDASDHSPDVGKDVTASIDRRTFIGALAAAPAIGALPARPPGARDLSPTAWRLLQLIDGAGLTYIDSDTSAVNLEVPGREARAALEELEHRGYVESFPVMYERKRSDVR
jgi:hypothetical protein